MSRLLWFVLGGIATAVGAGITSVLLDDGEASEPEDDTDVSQEVTIGNEGSASTDRENN
ncbi:hypothetical protein [Desulfovibrio falkowii]|uniref:hypothetical protein n=1 Tax=Desulfovibrio sp. WGS1351 TaxID=3366814 RepID=UPI00372D767F